MEIKIYRNITTPIYLQLVSQIKGKIITRELGAGDVLPSERAMAERLSIHRNTVTRAYKELESMELIESRQGYGYMVCVGPGGDGVVNGPGEPAKQAGSKTKGRVNWLSMMHSDYTTGGHKFDDIFSQANDESICPFSIGMATSGIYTQDELSQALENAINQGRRGRYFYTPYQGDLDLRKEIARFMREKGVDVSPAEIQVFGELNQAINFIGTLMLQPGDTVFTEEPVNPDIYRSFDLAGVRQITIPMDKNGMFTDNLDAMIEKYHPKFIYVSSSYHDPTGTILSYERRKKLLELSERYRVAIIEDDAASMLDYDFVSVPPLLSMDRNGNVLYIYSFELTFIPGMNVTFVVAPRPVIRALSYLVSLRLVSMDVIPQKLLWYCLHNGLYHRGLAAMKDTNRKKRDIMYSYIENAGIDDFYARLPEGGVYIWCHVPEKINLRELLQLARRKGVAFMPGYLFYPDGKQPSNYIRLNYSTPTESEVDRGMPLLIEAIKELL